MGNTYVVTAEIMNCSIVSKTVSMIIIQLYVYDSWQIKKKVKLTHGKIRLYEK